jgi:hypothetical protein
MWYALVYPTAEGAMGPQKADEPIRRISVFLTEQQLAALRRINERTGTPVAFLIRRGVDWIIQQHSGRRRARR